MKVPTRFLCLNFGSVWKVKKMEALEVCAVLYIKNFLFSLGSLNKMGRKKKRRPLLLLLSFVLLGSRASLRLLLPSGLPSCMRKHPCLHEVG